MTVVIDMGTTNLRIYALTDGKNRKQISCPWGANYTAEHGKDALYALLHEQLQALTEELKDPVDEIWVYGMGGSEYGIAETPRVSAPAGLAELSAGVNRVSVPALWDAPVYVIPGVFYAQNADGITELMRGEETETMGFLARTPLTGPAVLLLPGSHCKAVCTEPSGRIVSFSSTLAGEMLAALSGNTILKTAVSLDKAVPGPDFLRGARLAEKYGLNGALLKIRSMSLSGEYTETACSSCFAGMVLYGELATLRPVCEGKTVFVAGKPSLQALYAALLEQFCLCRVVLPDNAAEFGLAGVQTLMAYRKEAEAKARLKETIEKEKIIAIIRGLKKEDYLPTVQALYDGGIRLVEITFDASKKQSDRETAEIIESIAQAFRGKMEIGAGSVLTPEQVRLTKAAGGRYVISPNFDPSVVAETNRQNLVSIPGCFSPGEAVNAYNAGADFIKIFPNELGTEKYIKAIHAPLPHIPLLAVGGVNEDNLSAMLAAGARGVGIGSLLIDKTLIARGDFAGIARKAANCVAALNK